MRLRLSNHAIVVELPERSVWFYEITQKLRATFAKTFWANQCLINLPLKGEELKRQSFLLYLYKTCSKNANKHDSRFLKRLLESSHKPIKIQIINTSVPTKRVVIGVRFNTNALHVTFPTDETFLFWHLAHKLKPFSPEVRFMEKTLVLSTPSAALQEALKEFMSNPSRFGYALVFEVPEGTFEAFFWGEEEQDACELEAHYRTLELPQEADAHTLRHRYLQLAKAHHPDLAANNHEAKMRTQKFQQIQEAYHAIKAQRRHSA